MCTNLKIASVGQVYMVMLVRVVRHGYQGDRSYKGLPAYGDQHGTAPRHSGVPLKHTRVHTGTPPRHSKVHPGTPSRHCKVHFQSMATYSSTTKLRQPTAFATSMVMTTPAREGLRGRLSQGAQRDTKPVNIDMISGPASDATHRVLLSEVKRGLRSLVGNHILRAGALCQIQLFLRQRWRRWWR